MSWREYLQPIPFNRESLVDLLRDQQRILDSLGDWQGCREWLNNQDALLAETRQATRAVDVALTEQDTGKVKQNIENYFQIWRRAWNEYHAQK